MLLPSLKWLDVRFLEKVLKSSENDETIEVKNLAMTTITANGDHYFSDMIRTSVEYTCNRPDNRKAEPNVAEYTRGVFHSKIPEQLEKFFKNGLTVFAKEILDWPELGSRNRSFSEKILKLSEGFYKKGFECYKSKDDEFNVLNHGDCWSSNMLFRYNHEDKVVSHIFVDFQMRCWSTPLMDILLFMNSSMTEDVESNNHDDLLEEYLENLTTTMSRIDCKTQAPNKSIFKNIRPQYQILSIIASCVGLPVMFWNSSKTKSVDEIYEQSVDFDSVVYKKPEYRRRILRRLHAWEANGVFDV